MQSCVKKIVCYTKLCYMNCYTDICVIQIIIQSCVMQIVCYTNCYSDICIVFYKLLGRHLLYNLFYRPHIIQIIMQTSVIQIICRHLLYKLLYRVVLFYSPEMNILEVHRPSQVADKFLLLLKMWQKMPPFEGILWC